MAKVALDVILIWAGTHASIPSGYVRETTLDSKYPKGTADATNPATTGGNATHSHSATANHSHTEANHVHSITLELTTDYAGRPTGADVWNQHTHATHDSGAMVGGGLSSVSATYASVSNDPPFHAFIIQNLRRIRFLHPTQYI